MPNKKLREEIEEALKSPFKDSDLNPYEVLTIKLLSRILNELELLNEGVSSLIKFIE